MSIIQCYVQYKSPMWITILGKTCVQMRFHGPSLPIVCPWGKFGGLLCPRGTTYAPLRGMFLHILIASSNVVIHKFLRNSCSALQPAKFGHNTLSICIFRQIFLPLYEYRTPDRLYSTLGQISLKIWAEFGVCRVKALGGVRVDNFCRWIIIIRRLNSISVSWLSQANLIRVWKQFITRRYREI